MRLPFISRIYSNIARHTAERLSTDMELVQRMEARDSSARYAAAEMSTASRFRDRDSLLLEAVRRSAAVKGCICEFGVWSGYSLRLLADAAPARRVHGFDSFEGLPTDWRPGFAKGTFKTPMPRFSQSNVQLHKGWFDATLPTFMKELNGQISLAHIDCDIYSSTRCVLDNIAPRLAPGAILVFDEYFNYPGWLEHEHKALLELVRAKRLKVSYLAYNSLGEQVMVEAQPVRTGRSTKKR
ncbi:MAG: TylF/MycF/NovP-related O-methyltransferase [Gammaproteobacteria bacterium]